MSIKGHREGEFYEPEIVLYAMKRWVLYAMKRWVLYAMKKMGIREDQKQGSERSSKSLICHQKSGSYKP